MQSVAGKTRNPWGVWALAVVTLGIYGFYWWFKANQEAKDYDQRIAVEPVLALLALFVPIVNIVSVVRTGSRIRQAQEGAGTSERCSGGLGFVFSLLLGTHLVYYQSQLNKVWDRYGNPPEGTPLGGAPYPQPQVGTGPYPQRPAPPSPRQPQVGGGEYPQPPTPPTPPPPPAR